MFKIQSFSKKKILLTILSVLCVLVFMIFCLFLYNTINKKIYPTYYKNQVIQSAKNYHLNANLIFAFIKVESDFDKKAVSDAGAVGLMQILPSTADYIAKKIKIDEYDLFDEKINIEFGCYYLRYLIDKFELLDTAICAYNAGEGNVINWLKNKEYSQDGKVLKTIPFKETREYIKKIHKTFEKYEKLYGNILDK